MYNRYIPAPDGSYKKQTIPDCPPPCSQPQEQQKPPCPPPRPPEPPAGPVGGKSIGDFLGQLLPAGFDTEDLIVVLLLLLMSGNCDSGPNMPLVTMLIYLFL
ncbi:MAG: hypothetical protein PUD66_08565 [Oscillospiraceae bacterium]|nr:hypothetical protein [Oscillospiraceae bacterium]